MDQLHQLTHDVQRLVRGRDIARELDAIGINYYPAQAAFQVKIYEPPRENVSAREDDAPLLRFLYERNMVRCRCRGESAADARDYIALQQRTNENMAALFTELAHVHPGVSALADSLCRLSALPVCDDPAQRFAALHMIGFKNAPGQAPTLNLEWLLRRLPDPDQPGQYGSYDDATYLHALADERDTPLATLADVLQRRWFAHEKSQVLHLWLAAVDLAPVAPKKRAQRATKEQRAQSDGYERWKIYLRGEGRSLSLAHLAPFAHLHPNAEAGVRLLSDFYQSQQNLQLYGFALSLDSNNAYALNTYFIAE